MARLEPDESGKAVASLHPLAETYDLRLTSIEMGTWLSDVSFQPGERRKLEVLLKEAVSISGQVLAMDGSPQSAIVVQALNENVGRAALPRRPDPRRNQQGEVLARQHVGVNIASLVG